MVKYLVIIAILLVLLSFYVLYTRRKNTITLVSQDSNTMVISIGGEKYTVNLKEAVGTNRGNYTVANNTSKRLVEVYIPGQNGTKENYTSFSY